jgi:hypothetical protein
MSWHFRDSSGETYEAYVFHARPARQAPGGVNRGPAMLGFLHVTSGTVRARIPLPKDFPERPNGEYLQRLWESREG